jgi:hypothetical protein
MNYEDFIASKRLAARPVGIEPPPLNASLFAFQADIVRWALRLGRAAIWADCGLGKSLMALEWSRAVHDHTNGDVLIATPLAVARQFVSEGEKFGIQVTHCRTAADAKPGINVTNYERLHHFDAGDFAAFVADEASVLKDYTSKTRNQVIEMFAATPFRLATTATPAPNDHMELGNHAEFLGVMSRTEMLAMFFTHDGGSTQDWRLKGHARAAFWRWVASWAAAVRRPSDLGYPDDGFALPPLEISETVVASSDEFRRKQGALFTIEARGLSEQRDARRSSLGDRVAATAEIVNAEPGEQWLVFCDLNDESKQLAAAIPGAVEVTGSDDADVKEEQMMAFARGDVRVMVSKPSICGHGMNFQNAARMAFVGLSHSFEAWYQAIRREWRFGQKRPVHCYVITSEAEGAVVANLKRKQAEAEAMTAAIVGEMKDFATRRAAATARDVTAYEPQVRMIIPEWIGLEPGEEWRDCLGGVYRVTNTGRVRRAKPGKGTQAGELRRFIATTGYQVVNVCIDGERRTEHVHILVAEAFLGPRPLGLEINHKNGNKRDPRAENLEYITRSENGAHAWKTGLQPPRGKRSAGTPT